MHCQIVRSMPCRRWPRQTALKANVTRHYKGRIYGGLRGRASMHAPCLFFCGKAKQAAPLIIRRSDHKSRVTTALELVSLCASVIRKPVSCKQQNCDPPLSSSLPLALHKPGPETPCADCRLHILQPPAVHTRYLCILRSPYSAPVIVFVLASPYSLLVSHPGDAQPSSLFALSPPPFYSRLTVATSGYRRSAFSSKNSIHRLRNLLPLLSRTCLSLGHIRVVQLWDIDDQSSGTSGVDTHLLTVSESPMTVRERFGRVIATVTC